MPGIEMWTFNRLARDNAPVTQLGLNLGAPGDRRGPDGTLWLDFPSVGGQSPDVPVEVFFQDEGAGFVRCHTSQIEKANLDWVAASGMKGPAEMEIKLSSPTSIVIPNEVDGESPLEAENATVSARVPLREMPQSGEGNRRSLRKGSQPGNWKAHVKKLNGLASPSLTAEFWARTQSPLLYLDAHSEKAGVGHGFFIDRLLGKATDTHEKLRVRYYIPAEPGEKGSREVTLEAEVVLAHRQWAHVAFTYDAATGVGSLYRNGKPIATHDGPDDQPLLWGAAVPELVVGSRADAQTYVDELRICNEALDPKFFLTSKDSLVNEESVVGYWRMTPSRTNTDDEAAKRRYTVRLVFAEIDGLAPGERVFDVEMDGKPFLTAFDIAREAGGPNRTVVRELHDVSVRHHLRITLIHREGERPLLNGVQIVEQTGTF